MLELEIGEKSKKIKNKQTQKRTSIIYTLFFMQIHNSLENILYKLLKIFQVLTIQTKPTKKAFLDLIVLVKDI